MPCGSANPYLAAAVMLNAALLGVVDGRDCGDPQIGDGDAEPNTDRHTPHDLGAALAALEADTVLCEAMGPDLVKAFVTIRNDELAKWQAADGTWDVKSISRVGARALPAVLLARSLWSLWRPPGYPETLDRLGGWSAPGGALRRRARRRNMRCMVMRRGRLALAGPHIRMAMRFALIALVLALIGPGCSSDKPRGGTDGELSGVTIVTVLASDVPRVALVEQFIEAFNRGDRSAVLAPMIDDPIVSDCDYANVTVVEVRGRDQVSAWIDGRTADHDRFTVERIENGNTDASSAAIGVVFARRSSDSLRALGFADGVRPQSGAKVQFSGSGTGLRITVFANGPGGGPSKLCQPV